MPSSAPIPESLRGYFASLEEILHAPQPEDAGTVVRATGRAGVTGELTVRYRRPVPTEQAILGRGRLVTDHGRYVDVEGELVDPDTEDVLATGRGRFFPIKER